MKDDILKFRKLCDVLIKEKDYTVNKICIESGITWPTMKKLREEDIKEIKIRSSVLGQIQNYIRIHCDTIRFAGIKSEPIEKELPDPQKKHLRLPEDQLTGKRKYKREPELKPDPQRYWMALDKVPELDKEKINTLLKDSFWLSLKLLHDSVPDNVTVVVTINPKK